jgi:prephenate dehydratase
MDYLGKLKNVRLIETDDTAGSARWISESNRKGVGAIASSAAASIYNLEILAEGIETYKHNFTRFLVCSEIVPEIEGPDKASVCFSLGHEPGSLASLLVLLAQRDINLTRIQSIPRMSENWQYLFYLDLEFSRSTNTDELFKMLEERTGDFEILGVYTKNEIIYES